MASVIENALEDLYYRNYTGEPGRTLVVGSRIHGDKLDRRRLYGTAVGLDMEEGLGVDVVHNLEEPYTESFDHVDCCSVLEHVRRPWRMAANIQDLLTPGGSVLIAVPWAWKVHAYPSDYWRLSIDGVKALFDRIQWKELSYLVEGRLTQAVPNATVDGIRFIARSMVVGYGVLE